MTVLSTRCVTWAFQLEESYGWDSGLTTEADRFFVDKTGIVRLLIEKSGRITVMKGYAWNGCSPKVVFLDLLIGTPDGAVYAPTGRPKAYYASLVHDALYQFSEAGSPISRSQADRIFLRLLRESEFSLRWPYFLAVYWFGWFAWKGKSVARAWAGTSQQV